MSNMSNLADFMTSSLNEAQKNYKADLKILPNVKMVKIGGQSITDRGRAAMFPVLEELAIAAKDHDLVVSTGGGTRARHTYQVGLDLGMPVGILADMGGAIAVQNARMIQMLLAKHGGIFLDYLEFDKIPLYHRTGCIPVMPGMPPYSFWEDLPEKGSIPMHRTDSGVFLTGESLGVESILFIKDENGLYEEDPKKNPEAKFIERISTSELIEKGLNDLIIERVVVDYLHRAKNVKELQIINGMVKGNINKALNGAHVGTIIYKG